MVWCLFFSRDNAPSDIVVCCNRRDLCVNRFRKSATKSCWSVTSTSAKRSGKRTTVRRTNGFCSTARCSSTQLYIRASMRGMPTSVACSEPVSLSSLNCVLQHFFRIIVYLETIIDSRLGLCTAVRMERLMERCT